MLDSIRTIKTLHFGIKALERVEDGYSSAESDVKINTRPYMIYFRNEKKKISILWKEGSNENQALVKAKLLLGMSVSLDPRGGMMRKNQHHTIFELGFSYFARMMNQALQKEKENLAKALIYLGKKKFLEHNCHMLVYEDKNYGWTTYKCGKGETVSAIADKLAVSDYAIRTRNRLYSFFGFLKEGAILKVPNNYCKKIVLYLDEKSMLPLGISNYDEVGLFESYEYLKVEKNRKLGNEDFQQFYKD